ncbi:MAG: UvrD-helicase domain-containing protein [bacterium]
MRKEPLDDGADVNDILDSLNQAQREAVTAGDGPVLVVAGAGSGKTRVLTTRVAWLLAEGRALPGEILAFTFTNRAAGEMRERIAGTVGRDRAPFWIGTFHATGLKILRSDGIHIGLEPGFTIFDTDDSKRLIKQVTGDLQLDLKQFNPSATRSVISRLKNEDTPPEAALAVAASFVDKKYAQLYAGYEAALRRNGALDFDDLILRTVHLLEQHETVREKYARRFGHVLVDEFQDTNPLQLVMVKLLSSWHGNLFAVGDDDQSIYSWRGARIENMVKFDEFFPGAATYRLEQNYRSTGNILAAANRVIANNKQRKGKNLWTNDPDGDLLTEEEFHDDQDEAARLVDIIRAECAGGLTRSDVTVLYRTNAQSRPLEDAMRRARLPYQIVGSLQFYERKEVRDLLAYLKLVANPADEIAAQRVINVPKRQIGDTTVTRLMGLAAAEGLTLGQAAAEPGLLEREIAPAACRRVRAFFDQVTRWRSRASEGMPVHELLQLIVKETGYEEHLETDDPATAGSRSENVAELVNATAGFHESSGGGTLGQFLEQTALVSDPDTITDEQGLVRLMTIHTAKGLEFPVVVLAGCEEDILPHINSAQEEAGLEEERRLFYVALTRAERRVYLLHAARRRRFGSWQESLPSRFLTEVPDELIERRHLNTYSQPARHVSLFGDEDRPARPRPRPAPAVRPDQWGKRKPAGHGPVRRPAAGAGWDSEVDQSGGYYQGQIVTHGIFGSGVVERVEGSGDDMLVTVVFSEAGRKHINPRFAPLIPVE